MAPFDVVEDFEDVGRQVAGAGELSAEVGVLADAWLVLSQAAAEAVVNNGVHLDAG